MSNQCQFCAVSIPEGRMFCSIACRNRGTAQKMRATRVPHKCLHCGKEMFRHPCQVKTGRTKYCSRACHVAYVKEHGRPDRKLANRVCKNCGKDFTIPACWLKKLNGKGGQYCSRECFYDYSRKNKGIFGGSKKARWGEGSGTYTDPQGYVHEYDPERQKYIRQHRLVMERILGRCLEKGESVHHKNGKRGDNSPGNLELIVGRHFSGQRVDDLVEGLSLATLATRVTKLEQQLLELQKRFQ